MSEEGIGAWGIGQKGATRGHGDAARKARKGRAKGRATEGPAYFLKYKERILLLNRSPDNHQNKI